jgi:glutathione S-transferase
MQCAKNPLGRIPSLVLADDKTTLIDSAAILDWLYQAGGLSGAHSAGGTGASALPQKHEPIEISRR